jgi:hypothetical protein
VSADWNERCRGKEVRWRGRGKHEVEGDGEPFVVIGSEMYECVCGPDRHGRKGQLSKVNLNFSFMKASIKV